MSYFWCLVETRAPRSRALESTFARLVPRAAEDSVLRVSAESSISSSAASYGQPGPVKDVAVRGQNGSWVALLGTPLVRLRSPGDEQRFLHDFLADPAHVLREEVGGHFAAFGHDTARDRFVAATDFNTTIPIFVARTPSGVAFSSHELPLASFVGARLEPFGVAQFVQLGTTWGRWTRFRDVWKLTPARLMVLDRAVEPSEDDYWSPESESLWRGGLEAQMQRWLPALTDTVRDFYESSAATAVLSDFTAGEDARLLVAACHALEIPFTAYVGGSGDDVNVVVAKRAARVAGFDLIHRERRRITPEQVEAHALEIVAESDGYNDLFASCERFATEAAAPLDPSLPKLSGIPGGEAFRGSYYLRGKAFRPDAMTPLDYRAFLRWKYLLDRRQGLVRFDDDEFLVGVRDIADQAIEQVLDFPVGTQIDHMLRLFQTSAWGLRNRGPVYLPLATSALTRSIYCLRPRWKRGGRLTRACTEILWPELAFVRTQNGVPTVRKTLARQHLFAPEYLATSRRIVRGVNQRVLKLSPPNKIGYSPELNAEVLDALLRRPPYAHWFAGAEAMATGEAFDGNALNGLLAEAQQGRCRSLPILGRVLSQELALRWCQAG